MKTQLLQDLNESGSANARPPSPEAKRPPGAAEQRDAGVQPDAVAVEAAAPVTPVTPVTPVKPVTPAPAPTSAPAAPSAPARSAGPAVWHRPQQAKPPETRPPEPRPAAVRAAQPEASRPAAPANVHPTVQPRGFAPQPLPFGATVPAQDPAITVRNDSDPDWLTERLARDTAVHERPEWNGAWTRRLASWGAAGVLLALVAAGGLWLVEQSRVEGALVVVANTNPATSAPAAAPRSLPALPASTGLASTAAAPAPAPGPAIAPLQAPPAALPEPASTPSAAADAEVAKTIESAPVAAVDVSVPARRAEPAASKRKAVRSDRADRTASREADAAPPAHKRSSAHKPTKTVASAAVRENERTSERSYRQRYEETLMQCRAHGYDERQCLQRGCEMTRFGFACKG